MDPASIMESMTWKEVEDRFKETKTVLVPFGSTEDMGTICHYPPTTKWRTK